MGLPAATSESLAKIVISRAPDSRIRAAALRDQAHATWQRVQTVVDQGAGAPQDLDDATAALKVAEANLALARTRLAKTRITAPFVVDLEPFEKSLALDLFAIAFQLLVTPLSECRQIAQLITFVLQLPKLADELLVGGLDVPACFQRLPAVERGLFGIPESLQGMARRGPVGDNEPGDERSKQDEHRGLWRSGDQADDSCNQPAVTHEHF